MCGLKRVSNCTHNVCVGCPEAFGRAGKYQTHNELIHIADIV